LISRTTRAYDLVIHYDRDSHGGIRWSREDIDRIHHVGRYLHSDVSDLKHQQKAIAEEGKQDAVAIDEIRNRTENLREYCEQIQDLIKNLERVPLRQHMTRDDDGAQAGEPMDRGYESENARDDGKDVLL
jgi:DNA-binding protein H-NS